MKNLPNPQWHHLVHLLGSDPLIHTLLGSRFAKNAPNLQSCLLGPTSSPRDVWGEGSSLSKASIWLQEHRCRSTAGLTAGWVAIFPTASAALPVLQNFPSLLYQEDPVSHSDAALTPSFLCTRVIQNASEFYPSVAQKTENCNYVLFCFQMMLCTSCGITGDVS